MAAMQRQQQGDQVTMTQSFHQKVTIEGYTQSACTGGVTNLHQNVVEGYTQSVSGLVAAFNLLHLKPSTGKPVLMCK